MAIFTGGMTSTMKCFVAGTMILTAEGLVAIENIKAGDMVIATDPETGVTAPKAVLETYIRKNISLSLFDGMWRNNRIYLRSSVLC